MADHLMLIGLTLAVGLPISEMVLEWMDRVLSDHLK